MKSTILERFLLAPRLGKIDIWLTLLPLIFWLGAVQSRTFFIQPICSQNPERCTAASVPAVDRPGMGHENMTADDYSTLTQNLSGVLAVTAPIALHAGWILTRSISPAAALIAYSTDLVLLLQTAAWNGAFTETARILVQRPRPFVYGDPVRAQDPHNYVSFYSGHTSFAAATCFGLLLVMIGRGAPGPAILIAGLVGQSLVISTAAYRLLAGRHFLTDVLAGAAMGVLIACMVALAHRPKSTSPAL